MKDWTTFKSSSLLVLCSEIILDKVSVFFFSFCTKLGSVESLLEDSLLFGSDPELSDSWSLGGFVVSLVSLGEDWGGASLTHEEEKSWFANKSIVVL